MKIQGVAFRKLIQTAGILVFIADFLIGSSNLAYLIALIIFFYFLSEYLRSKNKSLPIITTITKRCARPEELKSYFIIAPIHFALSILILLVFFPKISFYIGTIALTLGDGFSGILGKKFGKRQIPYNKSKTLEGFLACFAFTLAGSVFFISPLEAIAISLLAAFIESSIVKYENIVLPLGIGLAILMI